MSFINKYCILGIVLVAIAGLWFPVGIVVDVFIIIGIVYFKNKAGAKKNQDGNAQQGSNDDIFKLMALSMMSGNLNTTGKASPAGSAKNIQEMSSNAQSERYSLEFKKKFLY
ncbi:MAG: hypothetical protein ACFFCS_01815 [Candidatus Hodarchaeota archaeon]